MERDVFYRVCKFHNYASVLDWFDSNGIQDYNTLFGLLAAVKALEASRTHAQVFVVR